MNVDFCGGCYYCCCYCCCCRLCFVLNEIIINFQHFFLFAKKNQKKYFWTLHFLLSGIAIIFMWIMLVFLFISVFVFVITLILSWNVKMYVFVIMQSVSLSASVSVSEFVCSHKFKWKRNLNIYSEYGHMAFASHRWYLAENCISTQYIEFLYRVRL